MNGSYNVPTSIYVAQLCTGRTRSFANLLLRPFYSFRTDLFIGSFFNRIVTEYVSETCKTSNDI